MSDTPLLDSVDLPQGLADLKSDDLKIIATEIREFLIKSVSQTGGHLSSSLGVIELTVALHTVFKSPHDKIVWDVGHQSYPHKILTGRKNKMHTLRQFGGLSGFSKRSESPHDIFGAGHASTSISAALGLAFSMKSQGETGHAIAVIGDGALTGGMAFEALNHAGDSTANLLVILNDNDMSISKNVGAMSRYLGRILSSRPYNFIREAHRKMLSHAPKLWAFAKKAESHAKGMVAPGALFEEMGFHYIGPVDGHDIGALLRALRIIKNLNGPQFLHIITKKGKGFKQAELNPVNYHGISGTIAKPTKGQTYTQVFGQWLCEAAINRPNLIAITPAMREGSGLVEFSEKFPQQFIDVGIAEQHAVTLAGGMACNGIIPVVAIYSTFLQRAYDQVIHDIALQDLPVIFAIDRAGLVGADGATHAGMFDLSFLRCIPNLIILTPAYKTEFIEMLDLCLTLKKPVAIRYPRGTAHQPTFTHQPIEFAKAHIIRTGKKIAILVFGDILSAAVKVAESLNATLVNMRFVKPLDTEMIDKISKTHQTIITIETNVVSGGSGVAIQEYLSQKNTNCVVRHLGLPDEFIEHGEMDILMKNCRLDSDGIEKSIKNWS